MNPLASKILTMVYSLIILVGCSYLVFWKSASPWWFLLAVIVIAGMTGSGPTKEDQ